jgi:hypothetical protein
MPSSFVLYEFWCLALVATLLEVLPEGQHDVPILRDVLSRADGQGRIKQNYVNSKARQASTAFQRKYVERHVGFQSISSSARNFCAAGKYFDVDIVNCHPFLLRQIFNRNGIPIPLLEEYVVKREDIIAGLLKKHPQLDRDAIKKAFIVAINQGNYMANATEGVRIQFLDDFALEIKQAVLLLTARREYAGLWVEAKTVAKNHTGATHTRPSVARLQRKKNAHATFISMVAQAAEVRCINSMKQECAERGVNVGADMFDGLMILCSSLLPLDLQLDTLLRAMEQRVLVDQGLTIHLLEKTMLSKTLKQMNPKPDLSNIGPDDKLVLFNLDGTLAVQSEHVAGVGALWHFRPGLESLHTLQQRPGYKVGLWSDRPRRSIPLADLQAQIHEGFVFDVVLSGEHSTRPTDSYRLSAGLDKCDKLKRLDSHFPNINKVVLVDDKLGTVFPEERDRVVPIATWDGLELGDDCLTTTIATLNFCGLPFGDANGVNVREYDMAGMDTYVDPRDGHTKHCIHPIHFDPGQRLNIIRAGMGSGKSVAIANYVNLYNPRRVIVFTARVQQAYTAFGLLGPLGFKLYNEDHRRADGTKIPLGDIDRVIVQFESAHKLMALMGGLSPYDLIIIDETRAVGQQTVWTENKDVSINNKVLTALLTMSPSTCKVVWLDADIEIDGMVRGLVDAHFKPTEWILHRYTHNALDRTFRATTRLKMVQDVKERLDHGERVMLCFRARHDLEIVTEMLAAHAPLKRQLIFKSKQDAEHFHKFAHIDHHLADVNLLAFTSSVTVGADIQTLFDKVFIFADSFGGCSYRDMKQMAGRARNTRDTEVGICFPTNDPFQGAMPTHAETLQLLQTNQINHRWYAARLALDPRLEFDGGKLVWANTALLERLTWKVMEETTDFKLGFMRMCRLAGYTFIDTVEEDAAAAAAAAAAAVTEGSEFTEAAVAAEAAAVALAETEADLKDATAANKEVVLAQLVQTRDALLTQFTESEWDRGMVLRGPETRVKGGQARVEDHQLIGMGHALHGIRDDKVATLRDHELAKLSMPATRHALHRCQLLEAFVCVNIPIEIDAEAFRCSALADVAHLAAESLRHLKKAVVCFGFAADFSGTVSSTALGADRMKLVLGHCFAAKEADSRVVRGQSGEINLGRVVRELSKELKFVGHKLDSNRVGPKKSRTHEYRIVYDTYKIEGVHGKQVDVSIEQLLGMSMPLQAPGGGAMAVAAPAQIPAFPVLAPPSVVVVGVVGAVGPAVAVRPDGRARAVAAAPSAPVAGRQQKRTLALSFLYDAQEQRRSKVGKSVGLCASFVQTTLKGVIT